jgi:hypothetical protein
MNAQDAAVKGDMWRSKFASGLPLTMKGSP